MVIDPVQRRQRLLTNESQQSKVIEDILELKSLHAKTFGEGGEIYQRSEAYRREVLEEFREARNDYLTELFYLEAERALLQTNDPAFVVKVFGFDQPEGPHMEGYEWFPEEIDDPTGGGGRRDAVRLGSSAGPDLPSEPLTRPNGGGLNEIKAILDENQTVPLSRKLAVISRFAWVTAGLSLAPEDGACAHMIMRRAVENKGDDDLEVSPKLKAALHALVKDWLGQSDSTYWSKAADMIDLGLIVDGQLVQFTIADQIYFMNFAVEMSPLQELWAWETLDDVWGVAHAIKAFYDKNHSISDVYRHALEVTYKGRAMPRGVTAKMLQLALGLIARDLRENG